MALFPIPHTSPVDREEACLEVSDLLMAADNIPRIDGKLFFCRKSMECIVKTLHYEIFSTFPSEKNEWKFWKIVNKIEGDIEYSARTKIWDLHNSINECKQIHWTPEESFLRDQAFEQYLIIREDIPELFFTLFETRLAQKYSRPESEKRFADTIRRVVSKELSDKEISEDSRVEDLTSEDEEEIDEILSVAEIAEEKGVSFGAWGHFDLGNAALLRGASEVAEVHFNEGLRIFIDEEDTEGILASYNCLSALAVRRGDLDEARRYWKIISNYPVDNEMEEGQLSTFHSPGDSSFSVLNGLGSIAHHRGKSQSAESLFSEAIKTAIELNDEFAESLAINNLAVTVRSLGRLDEAGELHKRSLEKIKALEVVLGDDYGEQEKLLESDILRGMALVEKDLGNISMAESLIGEALDIQRRVGDRYREAGSLVNLGNLASSGGRYTEAESFHIDALQIAKEVGAKGVEAGILMNLGNLKHHLSEFVSAESYYRQARQISRGIATPGLLERIHLNLGDIARFRGDFDEAMMLYRKALEISNALDEEAASESKAWYLGKIGTIHRLKQEYDEAEKCYIESLEIRKSIGKLSDISSSLGSLGIIAEERGDLDAAESLFNEALEIDRNLGDRKGESSMLACLSKVELKREDYSKAEIYCLEALSIRKDIGNLKGQATALHTLGAIYWYLGNREETEKLYRESLEIYSNIGYSLGEFEVLRDLGWNLLYDEGDYHESEIILRKCVRICIEIGVPLGDWFVDRGFIDPDADWTFPPLEDLTNRP